MKAKEITRNFRENVFFDGSVKNFIKNFLIKIFKNQYYHLLHSNIQHLKYALNMPNRERSNTSNVHSFFAKVINSLKFL